jgi:3-phenylpropionate/trans-cinnamate dioxygenase ferredoxin reductase subunit
VTRGTPEDGEFVAFWLSEGRVVAGMNVNVWDVTEPIQGLVRARAEVPVERLTDPAVPLEELAG